MNETPKPKSGWRKCRWLLISLAVFATLVAIFYTEENWRGKRAWLQCKAELEAKGAVLDWNKYIPPRVPDDQNFFTYSTNILLRFHKSQNAAQGEAAAQSQWLRLPPLSSNSFPVLVFAKSNQLIVAEFAIGKPANPNGIAGKNHFAIRLDDPAVADKVQTFIRANVGRSGIGAMGFHFSELPLKNLESARIDLESDLSPDLNDLKKFIPPDMTTNIGQLVVEATADPKIFQMKLVAGQITTAKDYLEWSDQFVSAFDDIREALKRPWAMLPGDYSVPYEIPIPNFVTMRALVQTLAQRTQCYLLLNQAEKALHELTLMHDVCRILERPTIGKPMTLVEAMINVAITGLYVATVQEGFRLHEWQEPQLAAIQSQMAGVNLPPFVLSAFDCEQAGSSHLLEKVKFSDITKVGFGATPQKKPTLWEKIKSLPDRAIDFAPHGWKYQNMAVFARQIQIPRENILDENQNVMPKRINKANNEVAKVIEKNHSPFYLLARIAIPNLNKAMQTCAFNQTLANQAQIVCALERFRLAHGEYPETLDALAPQLMEKIPHDIIGGQPLHYRRADDGKFLLYSVGWNEKDDGGEKHQYNNVGRGVDYSQGDWVWQYPQK